MPSATLRASEISRLDEPVDRDMNMMDGTCWQFAAINVILTGQLGKVQSRMFLRHSEFSRCWFEQAHECLYWNKPVTLFSESTWRHRHCNVTMHRAVEFYQGHLEPDSVVEWTQWRVFLRELPENQKGTAKSAIASTSASWCYKSWADTTRSRLYL